MRRTETDSFTLEAMTFRNQRWLSVHSVLAYLHSFAEQYDKIAEPVAARALRDAAEKLRTGERT